MITFLHFLMFFTLAEGFSTMNSDNCDYPKESMLYPECNRQAVRAAPVHVAPLPSLLMPAQVRWNSPQPGQRVIESGALWAD